MSPPRTFAPDSRFLLENREREPFERTDKETFLTEAGKCYAGPETAVKADAYAAVKNRGR